LDEKAYKLKTLYLTKKIPLLLLLSIHVTLSHAQYFCGNDQLMKALNIPQSIYETGSVNLARQNSRQLSTDEETLHTIPVIFHILDSSATTTNELAELINNTNLYLRKQLPEAIQNDQAVDLNIELCLSLFDKRGEILTEKGIHRFNPDNYESIPRLSTTEIYSQKTIEFNIKPNTIWQPKNYLNIWILPTRYEIGGYALPPIPNIFNTGLINQGIVLNKDLSSNNPIDQGRILAHELGHFLNLRHTWGTSNNGSGCLFNSDLCDDTPECSGPNFSCSPHESCGSQDMYENIMDYSWCSHFFTQDQKNRMRNALENKSSRKWLLQSTKCGSDSCGLLVAIENTTSTNQLSSDASSTLSISGRSPPYNYYWSNGNTDSIATGLSHGEYFITITDQNECSHETSTSILLSCQNISADIDVLSYESRKNSHDGKAIISNISGGQAPYTYLWSNGETAELANKLNEEHQLIKIIDSNNCSKIFPFNIKDTTCNNLRTNFYGNTLDFEEPTTYSLNAYGYNGSPPFSYQWNTGDSTSSIDIPQVGITPPYIVTIMDINGCSKRFSTHINSDSNCILFELQNFNLITTDYQEIPSVNFGDTTGTINISFDFNTIEDYDITWSHDSSLNTPNISNLASGSYSYTISNGEYCTIENTVKLANDELCTTINRARVNNEEDLSIYSSFEIDIDHINASNGSNGEATVYTMGGIPPFKIKWSNGDSSNTITELNPGDYTVSVTDNNGEGCQQISETRIEGPNNTDSCNLEATLITNHETSIGAQNGSVAVFSTQETEIEYLWNTGAETQIIENLAPGIYTVTLNNNTCLDTLFTEVFAFNDSININDSCLFKIQTTATNPTNNQTNNGSIFVEILKPNNSIESFTESYTFLWNNGDTNISIQNLPKGVYFISVTDTNNCTQTGLIQLTTIEDSASNSIKPLLKPIEFELFPNPSNGYFNLKTKKRFQGAISIYNIAGQLLKNMERSLLEANKIYPFKVKELASGIYYISIENNTGKALQPLFIKNE